MILLGSICCVDKNTSVSNQYDLCSNCDVSFEVRNEIRILLASFHHEYFVAQIKTQVYQINIIFVETAPLRLRGIVLASFHHEYFMRKSREHR